jgi:NAD(P)H-dependent flavin oxidoreductase YrpB (nitropropane dioxygenase family)
MGGGVGQRPSPMGIVDQLQLPIVLGPMAGGPGHGELAAAVS